MQTTESKSIRTTTNAITGCSVGTVEPEFFGVEDACRWSGIGRTNLFALLKTGKVRSIHLRQDGRLKGRRLIQIQSLREYLLTQSEGGDCIPAASLSSRQIGEN